MLYYVCMIVCMIIIGQLVFLKEHIRGWIQLPVFLKIETFKVRKNIESVCPALPLLSRLRAICSQLSHTMNNISIFFNHAKDVTSMHPMIPLCVRPLNHTLGNELSPFQSKTDCTINSSCFKKNTNTIVDSTHLLFHSHQGN